MNVKLNDTVLVITGKYAAFGADACVFAVNFGMFNPYRFLAGVANHHYVGNV